MSTTSASVKGMGTPIEPSLTTAPSPMGLQWVTGLASLRPYPSTSAPPVSSPNLLMTAVGSAAPPEMQLRTVRSLNFATSGWFITAMYIVGTPQNEVIFSFWMVFMTASSSHLGRRTNEAPEYSGAFMAAVIP